MGVRVCMGVHVQVFQLVSRWALCHTGAQRASSFSGSSVSLWSKRQSSTSESQSLPQPCCHGDGPVVAAMMMMMKHSAVKTRSRWVWFDFGRKLLCFRFFFSGEWVITCWSIYRLLIQISQGCWLSFKSCNRKSTNTHACVRACVPVTQGLPRERISCVRTDSRQPISWVVQTRGLRWLVKRLKTFSFGRF